MPQTRASRRLRAPRLAREDYTRLGQFSAASVVSNLDLYPLIRNWWKYGEGAYSPSFVDNGANARRPVGRICFFQQFTKVHDALRADFVSALSVDLQERLQRAGLGGVRRTPRVFVVGSVAGGTCSGMFLDVALLARHLLQQAGYERDAIRISGLFALPSVIHLSSGDGDTNNGRQRRVNSVAALRELDFLLDHGSDQPFTVEYPAPVGKVRSSGALFNHVFLFTDTKQGGHTFSQEEDVLVRAAHYLFGQISLGTGEQTLLLLDNHSKYFDPSQQRVAGGLAAVYGTFGVEWLEVPRKQLLNAWCKEIAERVGALVADFEWEQQPRQNIAQALASRMPTGFHAYQAALRVVSLDPQSVSAIPELADAESSLQPIASASKEPDLRRALNDFEVGVQSLIQNVRKSVSQRPTAQEEDDWLRSVTQELINDPGFRLGGARRVLRHAAEQLSGIAAASEGADEALDQVIERCKRGLFMRRIDSTAALDWARRRLHRQSVQIIRHTIGDEAARLSHKCKQQADRLTAIQHTVREESTRLGAEAEVASRETLQESWLLDPMDVDRAVRENLDAVTREVSNRVANGLSEHVAKGGGEDHADAQVEVARIFKRLVNEAIELAAVRRTERPTDTIERIKGRMQACLPLAHVVDDGPDFLGVMKADSKAVPLKMVVTGIGGTERAKLDAWAKEEKERAGHENAFQVVESGDPLRDDALYLSFGWPLCLFSEIQRCEVDFEQAEQNDPAQVAFSFVMKEVAGCDEHRILPVGREEARLLFAIAWALGQIRSSTFSKIVFESPLVGQSVVQPVKPETAIQDAVERVNVLGLACRVRRQLESELQTRAGSSSLRSRLNGDISRMRAKLEQMREQEGVPGTYVSSVEALLQVAAGYANSIVEL
ncbi:MAG: hypothetical protein IPK72_23110 [Candidatus Eisenbacteria bacterium]|nr:hypothetical protein [Candidatus Eisenbacteria bacterium]